MIMICSFAYGSAVIGIDDIDNEEVVAVVQEVQCDQPMVSTAMTSVDNDVGSLENLNVNFFTGLEDAMPDEAVPPDLATSSFSNTAITTNSMIEKNFGDHYAVALVGVKTEIHANGKAHLADVPVPPDRAVATTITMAGANRNGDQKEPVPPDQAATQVDFLGDYSMTEVLQIQNEVNQADGNFNYEASDGDGVVLPEETVADLNLATMTTALVEANATRGDKNVMTK